MRGVCQRWHTGTSSVGDVRVHEAESAGATRREGGRECPEQPGPVHWRGGAAGDVGWMQRAEDETFQWTRRVGFQVALGVEYKGCAAKCRANQGTSVLAGRGFERSGRQGWFRSQGSVRLGALGRERISEKPRPGKKIQNATAGRLSESRRSI